MYHNFFIHSSVNGHLGCFHVLDIVKQCYDEHCGTCVFSNCGFLRVYAQYVREPACNTGDLSLIPGSRKSPGKGNGYSLQSSCLENPMDRGGCWATAHRVTKSWTQLSDLTLSLSWWFCS